MQKIQLGVKEALNEIKEVFSSGFGIDEIAYIEENNFDMVIDNEEKHIKIITIYDKWKWNLFYVSDRNKFLNKIRGELASMLRRYATTHSYDIYEFEVSNANINDYMVRFYVDVHVDHKDNVVSVRRRVEIAKVTDKKNS